MSDFSHFIRIRFGLAPEEPTESQEQQIVASIRKHVDQYGVEPDIDALRTIVAQYCPSTGTWKYGAEVSVELRRQLAILAAKLKK